MWSVPNRTKLEAFTCTGRKSLQSQEQDKSARTAQVKGAAVPRKIAWFFLMTALLLEGRAKAQCGNGASFAVCPVADRIYVNTDKRLAALRLSDGSIIWQIDLPPREDSYTATAARKDVVVVWAGFPGTGIYAFDAKTARPLWHIETSSYGVISAGPYFVFSDAEHWEALTAVEERTGQRVWHHSGSRPTRGGVAFLDSNDRTIVTELFAIDSKSDQILQRWPKAWEVSAAAITDKFVVIGNRYSGPKEASLAVYSLPNYELAWVKTDALKGELGGLAVASDRIFAAIYPPEWQFLHPGEVQLELLEAASGKPIWNKTISSIALLGSPVGLAEGVAIFSTVESTNSRMVQGFDATTGQLKWTVRTDHRIDGVTCVGSSCYVGGEIGEVLAVDVQTGAQRWYRIPTE